ncbi:MAG: RNA recognition motif domain-containing protein [Calditrichaceae bacterium]
MKIFIGNVSKSVEAKELKEAFQAFGRLESIEIKEQEVMGKMETYVIVEMPVESEARRAMESLDGMEWMGNIISVHPARVNLEDRRKSGRGGGRRFTDHHRSEVSKGGK